MADLIVGRIDAMNSRLQDLEARYVMFSDISFLARSVGSLVGDPSGSDARKASKSETQLD